MVTDLWNLIIVNPLLNSLVFIYSLVGNYGVAILIFTVLIKLVTLPFSLQQQRAMKAQTAVQPELQALQKKYGKDKQKYQQEMMKLYKERGINPLGGCLPMLIPWPIFLAFYQSVSSVMSTQPEQFMTLSQHILPALAKWVPVNESFLWLNLSRPDPLFILPVLAGLTTWLQQKMMVMPSTDPQSSSMNQTMGIIMPFFMAYITWSFASGLAIYWVAFNIVGIIQQYFVTGWGEFGKYLPAPILKLLPGPASAPVVVAPAKGADIKEDRPKRRARVDVDGEAPRASRRSTATSEASEARPARRSRSTADTAVAEVKLPPRRAATQTATDNGVQENNWPAAPVITDPTRKVKRKKPQ